jgi:hypothetical protein
MLRGNRRWYDRPPDNHGASVLVSMAVTFALFAAAFGSMKSVARRSPDGAETRDPAVVIRLQPPPAPIAPPRVRVTPAPKTEDATRAATGSLPASVSGALTTPPPLVAPIAASPTSPASVDSSAALAKPIGSAPGIPLTTMPSGRGAPVGAAGVTIGSRTANTAFFRDSVAQARAALIPGLAKNRPATGAERAELQQSQRVAERLARRATTAGNSAGVNVMMGEGLGGVGAVGGADGKSGGAMMSVGVPLFSSGPSAAQRKINEKIDNEYKLRLRDLQDRINLKAETTRLDSLRRDSLRRDSLRKDSLARGLRRPERRPDVRE